MITGGQTSPLLVHHELLSSYYDISQTLLLFSLSITLLQLVDFLHIVECIMNATFISKSLNLAFYIFASKGTDNQYAYDNLLSLI